MVRVILSGCGGHMGRVMTGLIADEPEMEIVAGIDPFFANQIAEGKAAEPGYPVFGDPASCAAEADVLIDFSTASAADALVSYCVGKKLPAVLCATGYSDAQIAMAEKAAETIPVLRSANMSLGINLILKLLKEAAVVLAPAGFDIEIVEKHHRRKLDAPSGTALAMADSINEALGGTMEYVFDRSERHAQRPEKEIGISAVRGGTYVGEHDVIFAGTDEVFTFSHAAYSRAIFGKGAVAAAKFLAGKEPGLYSMADVIGG